MGQGGDDQISFEMIQEMFDEMRRSLGALLDGDLLWGYFFLDHSKRNLQRLAGRLEAQDYRYVSIKPIGGGFLKEKDYRLHVERKEHHTPESLYARNKELYGLASEYGVASYDGMDVGPVA